MIIQAKLNGRIWMNVAKRIHSIMLNKPLNSPCGEGYRTSLICDARSHINRSIHKEKDSMATKIGKITRKMFLGFGDRIDFSNMDLNSIGTAFSISLPGPVASFFNLRLVMLSIFFASNEFLSVT